MRQIPIAELVLDFDLYPRNNLDSSQIASMIASIAIDAALPPIIVDRKTKRVVDGFHRVRATRKVKGDNATILCIERDYKNDQELFEDAVRYNAIHGVRLDKADRTRCIIIAERLHIPLARLAGALRMPHPDVRTMRLTRIARDKHGLRIPLKNTIRQWAGRTLTDQQVEVNAKLSGMDQAFYARQLVLLIEADLLDRTDEKLMKQLERLHELLSQLFSAGRA